MDEQNPLRRLQPNEDRKQIQRIHQRPVSAVSVKASSACKACKLRRSKVCQSFLVTVCAWPHNRSPFSSVAQNPRARHVYELTRIVSTMNHLIGDARSLRNARRTDCSTLVSCFATCSRLFALVNVIKSTTFCEPCALTPH